MARIKKWEKIFVLKRELTDDEMVNFALQYRNNENCYLSARDDINDPGDRYDMIYSAPSIGNESTNLKKEAQIAKTMKRFFTKKAYGSIFLSNNKGYVIIRPTQIMIGAKRVGKPDADRNEPPKKMVQAALKLLPTDNIESIAEYKNY